jgi:hypothetical protein
MADYRATMPNRDRLMEVLSYDPDTGIFRWKMKMGARALEGAVAGGTFRDGYHYIAFDKDQHRTARLAWLYVYGEPVPQYVDHENRNRSDNRIANLREATNSQNLSNSIARKTSKSGIKGVTWAPDRKKWLAKICVNYKAKKLGYFATAEEAAQAYETAAREAFGEFARTKQETT